MSHYSIYECQTIIKISIICWSFTMKIQKIFHSPLIEPCDIHEISRRCSRKHCSAAFFLSANEVLKYSLSGNRKECFVSSLSLHFLLYSNDQQHLFHYYRKTKATNQILKVTAFCIKVSLKTINVFIISIVVFQTKEKIITFSCLNMEDMERAFEPAYWVGSLYWKLKKWFVDSWLIRTCNIW